MTRRDLQEVIANLEYLARIEPDPDKQNGYQQWLEAFRDLQEQNRQLEELTPIWTEKSRAA